MPSSAVPNADLPSPDLPSPDLPSPELPCPELPSPELPDTETITGRGDGPADSAPGATATLLRCDGCGTRAVIDQDEQHYGGLVHSFLGQHSRCGNAVQITRSHPGDA